MSVAAPGDTDPELFAAMSEAAFACLRRADEVFSGARSALRHVVNPKIEQISTSTVVIEYVDRTAPLN